MDRIRGNRVDEKRPLSALPSFLVNDEPFEYALSLGITAALKSGNFDQPFSSHKTIKAGIGYIRDSSLMGQKRMT